MLAQLLDEIDFILAWRQIDNTANRLGLSSDECDACVKTVWPQVEHHPYAEFIASYRADKDLSHSALREQMKSLALANAQFVEEPMLTRLANFDPQWGRQHSANAVGYWHEDLIAADLPRDIRRSSAPMTQIPYLRAVSPHMPFGVAQAILHGGARVQSDAAQLETRYSSSAIVQAALAEYFTGKKQWSDAVRCYKSTIKLDPNRDNYEALAGVYRKQDDQQNYVTTLEDYLKTDDEGLDHAQVLVTLANHFIEQRDWQKAREYADKAAETWAEWGMLKAAQCAEAMQDWDAAEQWYKNVSQRYNTEGGAFEWYKFCKRTGQGNAADAEKYAFDAAADHDKTGVNDSFARGTLYTLANHNQEAAQQFDKSFQTNSDLRVGVYAALAFDRVHDTKSRDRIITTIQEHSKKYPKNQPTTRVYLKLIKIMSDPAEESGAISNNFDMLEPNCLVICRAAIVHCFCIC